MSKHKITPRFSRKPGTQVVYTPEQTRRYKSLDHRIARAHELVDGIQEIPSDSPGRTLYFFPSDRAPERPGGWTVTVDETEPPRAAPPSFTEPSADPVGVAAPPTPATVFIAHLSGTFTPGLPPQIIRANVQVNYSYPSTAIRLPWIFGEAFAPGSNLISTVEAINLIRIIAPLSAAGQTLSQLGGGYWVSTGKLFTFAGAVSALAALLRFVPAPGQPVPASYSFDSTWREFLMPEDETTPLVSNGFPLNTLAYPIGVNPLDPSPTPTPVDPAAPDVPQDPPLPEDPGRAHYECNCPDYTRFELQDSASEFPSRWRDRVWTDSEAGAPVADDGKAYCKHVLAAMIKRGDTLPTLRSNDDYV